MTLLNPWVLLGALAAAIGLFLGGYAKGRADMDASYRAEQLDRIEAARETERLANRAAAALQEKRDAETRRINDRLADALERLRNRPARLPEPARPSCRGATGAELSGPDGGFLEREAARADELRAALAQCQAWVKQVTK
jgi:hypothetical protein